MKRWTVRIYHAKAFDQLRRQCDIASLFIRSLSKCKPCAFSGGKSNASFFRTEDGCFVVKELKNNWTYHEKQDVLKFAPKYLEYMAQTHLHPSVLVKIFGFYSIDETNLSTGKTGRFDFIVTEYLFGDLHIEKRFDLKGVEHRQSADDVCETLLDKDWISGQRASIIPLHAHSKQAIMAAIQRDTAFLAECQIMDYSLLVGVEACTRNTTNSSDEPLNADNRQVIVGIVDFIGSYTWYKRLETTSKVTLTGISTVVPPLEYAQRFCQFMDEHFLMIPGEIYLFLPFYLNMQLIHPVLDKWTMPQRKASKCPSVFGL